MSNNTAENSIRPFTVGRKNWLFSGSPKGAASSAAVYSIVETAKANGLNPHKYLQKLLEELPRMKEPTETDLALIMPWNDKIRKTCS
ncbi:transposase domain-containing protein [Proteiniclasticum sp.]|uniref:transposase domain-containing protein n=1 Tax=Proteiniclasticum sp. TaxID=2053595 RepID=UPI0025F5B9F8|nr:transposase domain-containing protein [Proteiniclasticum sp.]